MAAKFDEPLVDRNASPREFKARQLRAEATRRIYVAYAQAPDATADGQDAPTQEDPEPAPPGDSENDGEPTDPSAPDGEGAVEDPPADGEIPPDGEIPTEDDAEAYAADLGLDQDIPADERPTAGAIRDRLALQSLPPGCRYELVDERLVLDCEGENPFTQLTRGLTLSDGPNPDASATDEPAPARAMLTILRGTRTRPVPAAAGLSNRAQTEPVGVIVSVALTLVGLEDEDVNVYWSLYHAQDGRRVPREWLANRRADTTHAEATSDRRYSTFWVPLPRLRGPFYLRLSAVTEDGTTLDYRNTQHFD
jgi:hypothetical protein